MSCADEFTLEQFHLFKSTDVKNLDRHNNTCNEADHVLSGFQLKKRKMGVSTRLKFKRRCCQVLAAAHSGKWTKAASARTYHPNKGKSLHYLDRQGWIGCARNSLMSGFHMRTQRSELWFDLVCLSLKQGFRTECKTFSTNYRGDRDFSVQRLIKHKVNCAGGGNGVYPFIRQWKLQTYDSGNQGYLRILYTCCKIVG